LALSRQLENHTSWMPVRSSVACTGLERWAKAVAGRHPGLLPRSLTALADDEAMRATRADHSKAEYAMLREALEAGISGPQGPTARLDLALGLQAPWERQRALRLLNLVYAARLKAAEQPYWAEPATARPYLHQLVMSEGIYQTISDSPVLANLLMTFAD